MHNLFVIDVTSEEILRGATVLIDTNVIIDASLFKVEFADLQEKFSTLDCDLTTTRSVITEFLGSTKDEQELDQKINFLEQIFGRQLNAISLPHNPELPSKEKFLKFSKQANKFGVTDFDLFVAMQKYSHVRLLLMTRNHSDFTFPTFERAGFITLLGKKQIHTHGLYKYNH